MAQTRAVQTNSTLDLLTSTRARWAAAVVTFAILTALSAKIAVPIPGTAVPFTFQPLAVMLTGALLGARLGASSQVLYLLVGLAGVPVFAGPVAGPAYLLGPTGGYLLAYPLAAYLTGRLTGSGYLRNFVALLAGLATIYAGGVAWLAVQSGWAAALSMGLLPFVAADLVKAGLVLVVADRLRDRCKSLFSL